MKRGGSMGKYILQRFIYMLITLFIIVTITFFIMKLLPGTPFSNPEKLSESQLEVMNAKYGLDKPLAVQYLTYIGNLIQGDLGLSFQSQGRTVRSEERRVGKECRGRWWRCHRRKI